MGWRLTPKIREILKKPHGELIRGSLSETAEKIKLIVEREKPSMLISCLLYTSPSPRDRG